MQIPMKIKRSQGGLGLGTVGRFLVTASSPTLLNGIRGGQPISEAALNQKDCCNKGQNPDF